MQTGPVVFNFGTFLQLMGRMTFVLTTFEADISLELQGNAT